MTRRIHDLLLQWVVKTPHSPAVVDTDGRCYSYADFGEALDDAKAVLLDAGIRPGDRVLLVGENSFVLVVFLLACSLCDAWAVPVNARMTSVEIAQIKDHAEPRILVFTHLISDDARRHADVVNALESSGRFGCVRIKGELSCCPGPVFDKACEQVAALLYTTGTTGPPKGVMLTHDNFIFMAHSSATLRGMTTHDVILGTVPVTHIFGLSSAFLACIAIGASIRYMGRFEPDKVFKALAEDVSIMPAVPQIYALLMQYAEQRGWQSISAPRLKYMSAGGAPLDLEWKHKVEAFFGLTLHNGYGMTETSPGICATRVGLERQDVSCGPPLDGVEVRIVPTGDMDPLQEGVGEIVCRGPNVMKGYYKNPEATAETIDVDGFLHTGDLGKWTDDGAIIVVGRSKELIIRSGFNVYPPEVEAALTQHPAVALSAVVGRRLENGNEEVVAFVQTSDISDLNPGKLDEHLKPLLAPYKRPGRYVITTSLPAAATGKILKHKLLQIFANTLSEGELKNSLEE